MFHIILYQPEIPPNTGNAIRLCANTGCQLHLIEPLGFAIDSKSLRRAGLDYRDAMVLTVHTSLEACYTALEIPEARRLVAFSTRGQMAHTAVRYRPGDALLFGAESCGLPAGVRDDPRLDQLARLPMVAGSRSLNLSNSVAIVTYEAWRQQGFAGAD